MSLPRSPNTPPDFHTKTNFTDGTRSEHCPEARNGLSWADPGGGPGPPAGRICNYISPIQRHSTPEVEGCEENPFKRRVPTLALPPLDRVKLPSVPFCLEHTRQQLADWDVTVWNTHFQRTVLRIPRHPAPGIDGDLRGLTSHPSFPTTRTNSQLLLLLNTRHPPQWRQYVRPQ